MIHSDTSIAAGFALDMALSLPGQEVPAPSCVLVVMRRAGAFRLPQYPEPGCLGALQGGAKSVFHGKKGEKDYAGKSWLEPPKGLKAENEYCYLPKRWIHTWSGHTKVRTPAGSSLFVCLSVSMHLQMSLSALISRRASVRARTPFV